MAVEITLFGPPLVLVDGEDLLDRLRAIGAKAPGKANHLLLLLALHEGRDVDRDRLARLIWPQSRDRMELLRKCLCDLRKALGTEDRACLESRGYSALRLRGAAVDLWDFLAAGESTRREALVKARRQYARGLLLDIPVKELSSAYEALVTEARQRLARLEERYEKQLEEAEESQEVSIATADRALSDAIEARGSGAHASSASPADPGAFQPALRRKPAAGYVFGAAALVFLGLVGSMVGRHAPRVAADDRTPTGTSAPRISDAPETREMPDEKAVRTSPLPAGVVRTAAFYRHYNQGGRFYYVKDYRRALDEYRAAQALCPDDPATLQNLAQLYAFYVSGPGDREKSLALFTRVLQKDPENSHAFYDRAVVYRNQHRDAEAIRDFREVLRIGKDPQLCSRALVNLGQMGVGPE